MESADAILFFSAPGRPATCDAPSTSQLLHGSHNYHHITPDWLPKYRLIFEIMYCCLPLNEPPLTAVVPARIRAAAAGARALGGKVEPHTLDVVVLPGAVTALGGLRKSSPGGGAKRTPFGRGCVCPGRVEMPQQQVPCDGSRRTSGGADWSGSSGRRNSPAGSTSSSATGRRPQDRRGVGA